VAAWSRQIVDCNLKAVALKAVTDRNPRVKKTHKGPLRDVLAKNMRRLRAARGISQEALAHECGINRTYLSGVERSERNVSIDNIARIARGLKVKASELLTDT
jgi:ribosome-binding protein aMBF1 (putative translation factor)